MSAVHRASEVTRCTTCCCYKCLLGEGLTDQSPTSANFCFLRYKGLPLRALCATKVGLWPACWASTAAASASGTRCCKASKSRALQPLSAQTLCQVVKLCALPPPHLPSPEKRGFSSPAQHACLPASTRKQACCQGFAFSPVRHPASV